MSELQRRTQLCVVYRKLLQAHNITVDLPEDLLVSQQVAYIENLKSTLHLLVDTVEDVESKEYLQKLVDAEPYEFLTPLEVLLSQTEESINSRLAAMFKKAVDNGQGLQDIAPFGIKSVIQNIIEEEILSRYGYEIDVEDVSKESLTGKVKLYINPQGADHDQ